MAEVQRRGTAAERDAEHAAQVRLSHLVSLHAATQVTKWKARVRQPASVNISHACRLTKFPPMMTLGKP
jgi:hypothetical protein